MGPLKHGGLALALSSASTLQFCLLIFLLKRRVGILDLKPILLSTGKFILGAMVMGAGIFYAYHRSGGLTLGVPKLIGIILLGTLLYFGVTWMLGCRELKSIVGILRPKKPVS